MKVFWSVKSNGLWMELLLQSSVDTILPFFEDDHKPHSQRVWGSEEHDFCTPLVMPAVCFITSADLFFVAYPNIMFLGNMDYRHGPSLWQEANCLTECG